MKKRGAGCNSRGALLSSSGRKLNTKGEIMKVRKRSNVPGFPNHHGLAAPTSAVTARLAVDYSDPHTEEAIRLLEDAGCLVSTVPVSAQPFPEAIVQGRQYVGLEEIRSAANAIKSGR